jgi:hypothetical protein
MLTFAVVKPRVIFVFYRLNGPLGNQGLWKKTGQSSPGENVYLSDIKRSMADL